MCVTIFFHTKKELLNPYFHFIVIFYAFFQGKLECGGRGDDNKPDSSPSQRNHYRGKQSQTNTNKCNYKYKKYDDKYKYKQDASPLARKHKTKHKQYVHCLVLIFVKIVNKSFSKL